MSARRESRTEADRGGASCGEGSDAAMAPCPPEDDSVSAGHLTRRAVLAGASGAVLLAALGGCAELSQSPPRVGAGGGPAPTLEPRSAPSSASYRQKLVVQRAEPAGSTKIAAANWRLKVGGLVGKPLELSYDDLASFPKVAQTSALHCVEGWSVADLRWEGIRLSTLLEAVEPLAAATSVIFDTFPGVYRDSLSLEQARLPDVLLAYRLDDAPLTDDLGFPLRLVVPRMYAYKSVKWIDRITIADKRELGFWVARGYPDDAWLS